MYNIDIERVADSFKEERVIVIPYSIRELQMENPITRQLFVTHIGYYSRAQNHRRERLDGSEENILIYCKDGKGWIDCNGTRYILTKNKAFIIPAGEPHIYGSDNAAPWSICWFHFKGENTYMFSSIIGQIIHVEESDKSRYNDRFLMFDEMCQNLELGYSQENIEYVSFCLMHFMASLKYINQYREVKKAKESDIIQQSILFMKENLENKISLKDIAEHIGYTVFRFNSVFSQKTSYTPIVYYNQLKIQRACSYLQFSDLKVKEIAFRLGYYDQFHFSRAFRQEMGITPKDYRKKNRDERQSFAI